MRSKYAALSLVVVMIVLLVSCNQGKIDELTDNVARLESQNQKLLQENNSIKAYIEEVTKVIKAVDQDLENIIAAEVDIREMTKGVDLTSIESSLRGKLDEIGNYIIDSKEQIAELEKSLASAKHDVKGLRSLVSNLKTKLEAKESEITQLAEEVGVLQGDLANLNTELEEKNELISDQEDMILQQNTRYYIMAKGGELKNKGIIESRGGFLGLGRTTKLASDFSTQDFSTMHALNDLELNIPVPAKKVKIYSPHAVGSYSLVDAGEQSTLMISDPGQFWATSKCLVIETK